MPGDDGRIYRRKRCTECGLGFNTVEIIEADYTTGYIDALQSIVNYASENFKHGYHKAYYKKHPKR
jgi:transcriptional regulator NrdR family protein